jgi:hypothetical protein
VREDGAGPVERRRSIINFVGDDDIVLTRGPTRVPMVRVRAGSHRRPTEAPSATAAPPSASTAAPAAGTGAAPSSPSRFPALDACEQRYFACVAAMPPEARSAMGSSIDAARTAFAHARSDAAAAASLTDVCQSLVQTMELSGYCSP